MSEFTALVFLDLLADEEQDEEKQQVLDCCSEVEEVGIIEGIIDRVVERVGSSGVVIDCLVASHHKVAN
jgi:hypothetical protein